MSTVAIGLAKKKVKRDIPYHYGVAYHAFIFCLDKKKMYVYLRTFYASLVLNFTTNFYNSNCDQEVNKY